MPLIETRNSGRSALRYVPALWPSPMLPSGPNLAATLTAVAKYISSGRDTDLFELGPVDIQAQDHGRSANAFRLAGINPIKRRSSPISLIDLKTVANPESRLCQQLTHHQHSLFQLSSQVRFLRYRSGENETSLSFIKRRLTVDFPSQWPSSRRDRISSLLEVMDDLGLLDVSLLCFNDNIQAILIAHKTDSGLEGGHFIATSDEAIELLIGELVRDGLASDHGLFRLSSYETSINDILLPWASRLSHPITYQVSSLFSSTGLASRLDAWKGTSINEDIYAPSLDYLNLTSVPKEHIPLQPHASKGLRLYIP